MMLALFAFAIAPVMQSCKSSKSASTPAGETAISVYCSGGDYQTNSEYFRANNSGESSSQSLAKKKALSNARQELAASMGTTVKTVIDDYVNSFEQNGEMDDKEIYEGLSREVINEKLNGIRTICEQFTKTAEGNYKCYVAIELAGDEILNGMNQRISKDDRLQMRFEKEKFEEKYNKEMEAFDKD